VLVLQVLQSVQVYARVLEPVSVEVLKGAQ